MVRRYVNVTTDVLILIATPGRCSEISYTVSKSKMYHVSGKTTCFITRIYPLKGGGLIFVQGYLWKFDILTI